MSSKQQFLLYDLAAYFVTEKNYDVLYMNIKENEIWLSNESNNEESIIRILNKNFDWKNRLKSDMAIVFQRVRAIKKKFSQRVINVSNIYIAEEEPVDDWKDLLKPLRLNDRITYNMSVFYLSNDNLLEEIHRINKNINADYEHVTDDIIEEDKIKSQKNLLISDIHKQKKQNEKVFTYGKPFYTFLIIAINIFMFIALEINGGSTNVANLIDLGAKYNPAMIDGEWWRVISSMFLHIGLLHLFMNMLALYYLGVLLERIFGSSRFLVIYFLSGIGGSLTSFALSTNVSAGASGALFGLFGALLFFGVNYQKLFFKTMGRNVIFILILNLFIGVLIPSIDMGAHLGGLITGFLAAAIVSLPNKKNYKISIYSTIAYLLIVSGLVFFGIETNEKDPEYLLMQTEESIKSENYEEAIAYATKGLTFSSEVEAKLLFQRAYAHLEINELEEAQNDLEKTIKKEPHFPEAYYNLAIIHYENQEMSQARKYIDKAMSQTSDQEQFKALLDKIKQSKE